MAKTKPKEIYLEKMLLNLNSVQEHLDQARIEVGLYEQRRDYDKKGIAYELYRVQEYLDQIMDEAGLEPHQINVHRPTTADLSKKAFQKLGCKELPVGYKKQIAKKIKRRREASCDCDHYPPLSDLGW